MQFSQQAAGFSVTVNLPKRLAICFPWSVAAKIWQMQMVDVAGFKQLQGSGWTRVSQQIPWSAVDFSWSLSIVQVDHVLQQHPDVAEAATFAVPEPMFGQVAQAAVVLGASSKLQPAEAAHGLQTFVKSRLEDYKVSTDRMRCQAATFDGIRVKARILRPVAWPSFGFLDLLVVAWMMQAALSHICWQSQAQKPVHHLPDQPSDCARKLLSDSADWPIPT